MKPLKKPIKPLNYEANDKVYLYESSCFLSCFNTSGAPGGYWSGSGCVVANASSNPACGSQCNALTGTDPTNCGGDSCYNNVGTIGSGCDINYGVSPGGCFGALCVSKVQTEGYSCDAAEGIGGAPGIIKPYV
ncbi:MAG: hypothetical protein WHS65_12690 [Melioribacteraceae bacterium]